MVENTDFELTEQVRQLMAESFGVDETDLPDDVSQENFSRWTSLASMTLLASLEEHFDVSFNMDELATMTSLPKIIAALKSHGINA